MKEKYLKYFRETEDYIKSYETIENIKGINLRETMVLNYITTFTERGQICNYTYNEWATILSCSSRYAKTIIKKLKEKGYIDWQKGNLGKSNIYRITEKTYSLFK
jgi:DNA-binding MarR family transcriptional regulator